MYKPPFTGIRRNATSPQPSKAGAGHTSRPGTFNHDCPVLPRAGAVPKKAGPTIQLADYQQGEMADARNVDKRKEVVHSPMALMSTLGDKNNPEFLKTMEDAKTTEVWIFPEECTGTFISGSGLAYDGVLIIGINGRQWPLRPGKNRIPGFVFEALEDIRDMQARFKNKLAPAKGSGRSVVFSDGRSGMSRSSARMISNPNVFNDSRLGRPGIVDSSVASQAAEMGRINREAYFKSLTKS